MSADINLIIDRRDRVKQEKIFKKVQLVTYCALFLVMAVSAALFILNVGSPFESLVAQKNELQSRLAPLLVKEKKYIFVQNRIQDIEKIVTGRIDYDKLITLVRAQIPDGITIKELNIKNDDSISLHVSSLSLIPLSEMFDNFTKLGETDKRFKKIQIQELSLNIKQGGYNATMTIRK